ncbi:MAG: OadG family protein [Lachnospiraceae bacterium]|nr:OadG family protein [Lachnospiraceae bacterium]
MKKRLLALCLSLFFIFSLTSCGSDLNKQKEIYGQNRLEVKENMQKLGLAINSMKDEDLLTIKDKFDEQAKEAKTDVDKENATLYSSLMKSYSEVNNELGDFEGFGDFSVTKAGKTVTFTLNEKFDKRNADFVFVYTIIGDSMKLTGMNVNPIYTKGEIFKKAGLNVITGMLTVFCVLILISLIIYAFNIFPYLEEKKKAKVNLEELISAEDKEADLDLSSDLELVAVITAAICAAGEMTTDDFVVRHIKRR